MVQDSIYRFEDFVLDTTRGALLKNGRELAVRRQSYDVLVHLVQHAGRLVTREELLEAVWPGKVVTDASVTQCLVDIRAALDDRKHEKIRTLARRGYRFEVPVRHSEPLPSAPAEGDGDGDGVRTQRPRAGAISWLAAIVAVATLLWVAGRWFDAQEPPSVPVGGTSDTDVVVIAALPLENLAPGAQDDAFVIGFHDALAAELGRHPRIQLIGRWSIEALGSAANQPETLRASLGADYALTGSVARDSEFIRFAFQLHDTSSGRQAWSESYIEPLGAQQLISLQQAVASSVAQEASSGIAGGGTEADITAPSVPHFPQTESLEAYEHYLDGLVHFRRIESGNHTPEILEAGRREFEAAMAADPGWAPPHAELARMLSFVASTGMIPEAWRASQALAERSVALDPEYAPAHMQLGFTAFFWERDYAGALRHFDRAQALGDPSDWARAIRALSLGRADEAVEHYRRALRGDPLNPSIRSQYGLSLMCAERWERAVEVLDVLRETEGTGPLEIQTAYAAFKAGHVEQALRRAAPHRPHWPYWDGRFRFDLGDLAGARIALDRLAAMEPVPLPQAAGLAVLLGERDQALRWLEGRAETDPGSLRFLLCERPLQTLEGDPRFDAVLSIIGVRP